MNALLLLSMTFPVTLLTGTPAAPAPDDTSGSIQGKVTFEGERPDPLPDLTIGGKESEGCVHGAGHVDPTDRSLLIADDGGVANVVLTVSVKNKEVEVPKEPVVVDQKGCRFEPHVTVVPVGTTLRFANSDGVNHNVHTYAVKNKQLNNNIAGGAYEEQTLEKEEEIKVTCDVHPWMSSYVIVTEEPVYAVTKADGSFQLEGLPAGTYEVDWWHEKLGKGKSDEVTVEPGKSAELEVAVGAEDDSRGGRRGRRGRR